MVKPNQYSLLTRMAETLFPYNHVSQQSYIIILPVIRSKCYFIQQVSNPPMVDAGLTPYEALRSGTANVGRYFNRPDIGVIKKNAVADLILLNGNPLKDIEQTKNIEGVMLGNNWLSKSFIEQELKKLVK